MLKASAIVIITFKLAGDCKQNTGKDTNREGSHCPVMSLAEKRNPPIRLHMLCFPRLVPTVKHRKWELLSPIHRWTQTGSHTHRVRISLWCCRPVVLEHVKGEGEKLY